MDSAAVPGADWSPATGAHTLTGAIRSNGAGQHFQGGSVHWSPATGRRWPTTADASPGPGVAHSPVWLTPYSAWAAVNPSNSSWLTRPEREKDE